MSAPESDRPAAARTFEEVRADLARLEAEAAQLAAGGGQPGTDIVPARSADPVQAKAQLAAVQAKAQKAAAAIRERKEELTRLLKAEMARAEAALAPMQELVETLQQNILTVNLYLGRDEDIVLLADGDSAPASEPITLRQALLFMDEECAVAAEEGGLSPVNVEAFDAWLLADPAHLDQVLPETKGIVALRPRRRRHRDGWSQRERDANLRTYWLVRNGQRLYRTVTLLEAGDRVLPYADEFERLFTRRERGRAVPLRPGSFEWERAQGKAKAAERQYMRVGLLLEGLLHRTPIFHPLPEEGVSFLDPACVRDGRVRYITDAEGLLTAGQETFRQWRERLASELRPGMRIILGPGVERHDYEHHRGNRRLHPSVASLPEVRTLHTLEQRKGKDGLVFRYREEPRWVGDSAWGGGEYREPKRRASCTVYPSDEFLLPFDLASVEEMERFLNSRESRQDYVEMWPILKAAIAAKHREAQVEAPFRMMLAGVLARDAGVTVAQAERDVPELVEWFKLKNRYHRPLLPQAERPDKPDPGEPERMPRGRVPRGRDARERHGDAKALRERLADEEAQAAEQGAKAVRMITAEYRRRLADRGVSDSPEVLTAIRAAHPHRLALARLRRGGYLALDPAEPAKDVWVHETEYTKSGKLRSRREWVLPGLARPKSWVILDSTPRWEGWDLHARESGHLRGPELQEIVDGMIARLAADDAGLALGRLRDGRLVSWRLKDAPSADRERPLTGASRGARLGETEHSWRREHGQVITRAGLEGISSLHARDGLPWEQTLWRGADAGDEPRQAVYELLWSDGRRIGAVQAALAEQRAESERADAMAGRVNALVESVRRQWLAEAWAAERRRFDEDFGDPDLWEAHARSKSRSIRFPHDLGARYNSSGACLWAAAARLVEAGDDPGGMTVKAAVQHANERFSPAGRQRPFAAPEEVAGIVLGADAGDFPEFD